MKKILSVALSTAMAFSMFASVAFGQAGLTDVNAQYNYLKDKGIFNGYPDGQAHLDRSMTRAEFAKVITKTLGLKEVTGVYSYNDKNYGANHWAAPYVEAVTAEGIMEGKNTTKKLFDLSGSVTVQEMATVLVRALDLEIPKETNNTASAWAKGYVQAAINAGLVEANANFQSNATRELLVGAAYAVDQKVAVSVKSYAVSEAGKVVEFTMNDGEIVKVTLDKALEANKETEVIFTYKGKEFTQKVTYVVTAAAVESVSAINTKTLEVKFNTAVDADKAKFAVKKGTITANFAKVTFADDKKSATIELSSKLTKGDYTVTVTGLTEEALIKTVSVENEKVAGIEILSENAIIDASNSQKVSVAYKVVNQYNEDITKTTSGLVVTSNVGSNTVANQANGVIDITSSTSFKTGDKISLSILDAATSTFASKVVTVSDKAATAELAITGLVNTEDSKAVLSTDTSAYGDFKLVVDAKDQYGKEVAVSNIAGDVIVTTSDATVVDFAKTGGTTPDFKQVTINGKKQTTLALVAPGTKKSGKATISIISKTTGKMAQFVVEVHDGVKADTITLTTPELAVAGEKTEIPFSVLGLDGAEITKASVLSGSNGVSLTDNDAAATVSFVNDAKTGKAKLILDDTGSDNGVDRSKDRKVMISATTANGKVATLFVDVKAAAEGKVITGTQDIVTNLAVGGSFKLNKDTVVVKDQYGRNFDLTGKLDVTAGTNNGKYLVKVEKSDLTANTLTVSSTSVISSQNNDVTVTGAKKGSETIKLTLQKVVSGAAVDVASSELELNVKVADTASLASYEVKEIGAIYDADGSNPSTQREVVVYGVTADGTKVVVPKTEYTVVTGNEKLKYNSSTGKVGIDANVDIVGSDNKDVTVNVKVIVNATEGPVVIDTSVIVSKAAPKAEKIKLESTNVITFADGVLSGTAANVVNSTNLKNALKVTDQYGEDITSGITLTVTNLVNSNKDAIVPTVSGNGTETLTFTNIEEGDSYNLTFVVGGKTLTAKVVATDSLAATADVELALTTPTADVSNTITGGGNVKNVVVNVAKGKTSVVIKGTKVATQTLVKGGTDATDVIIDNTQGSNLNPTITVDTTSIKDGGSKTFTVVVTEAGKKDITYNITVNVANN